MVSPGFLVISFAAAMLVILPSIVLLAHGWRSSNLGRVFVLLAFALILFFGWATYTDLEVSSFEEKTFYLYLIWGFSLYLGIAVYAFSKAVFGFLKRRRT